MGFNSVFKGLSKVPCQGCLSLDRDLKLIPLKESVKYLKIIFAVICIMYVLNCRLCSVRY